MEVQQLNELRRAVRDLQHRGLHHSARWAAEHVVALHEVLGDNVNARETTAKAPADAVSDVYDLAKAHFDLKEYLRCAHLLIKVAGHDARFLRCYALYLAGEKRKDEEVTEQGSSTNRGVGVLNKELAQLEAELGPLFEKNQLCPFGCYMYGVVLTGRDRKADARVALVRSCNTYPCHWGAWLALLALCTDAATLAGVMEGLEKHWMRDFFEACAALEHGDNLVALQRYTELAARFPGSRYCAAQVCVAQYNERHFEDAATGFEAIVARDPFRLESLDVYSNILYVTEDAAALAHLAHLVVATDKYRCESCCVVGNYYSLKGAHETAILYFRRALRLNPAYLAAWTLMGHEYVELKNPSAAVEAYRAAVNLSPRDYRAWYGLGQTYELLGLQSYALHYYKQAAALRPDDARMWCAIGMCYESAELDRTELAMSSYRRALQSNDTEGLALARLAKLHAAASQPDEAAHYYQLNLHRLEDQGAMGAELLDALTFLAVHAKKSGRLEEAEQHCTRLMDFGGPSREMAKRIMRELTTGAGPTRRSGRLAEAGAGASPMQTSHSPW